MKDCSKINIYGTIGPSCASEQILKKMFEQGMTGIRLNTSHTSLKDAEPQIEMIHTAAAACGIKADLLIDLQGPELRLGKMETVDLIDGMQIEFGESDQSEKGQITLPVPASVRDALSEGQEILLDDGKILLSVKADKSAEVIRGGRLTGGKSIALPGVELTPPTLTRQDVENVRQALDYGVTGVMQPFVRSAEDLKHVRETLNHFGGENIRLLAKIENMKGVENLVSFFPYADEIVIARGDLGNAIPLWELPRLQKQISAQCLAANKPFMVVTQMLASMEHSAVPTRAEVSDIYNAVCDGASSVMVTGETAVGEYPVEVIKYLAKTVQTLIAQSNSD